MVPVRIVAAATATPIIAAAAEPKPVIWEFLGLHFEAGPLVCGLCGVALIRATLYLQKGGGRKGLALDFVVFLLCCFVTALWVQDQHMKAFIAGAYGMGIGITGIGLLGVAKSLSIDKRLSAAMSAFVGGKMEPDPLPDPTPPTSPPTPASIRAELAATPPVPDTPEDMSSSLDALDSAERAATMARLNPRPQPRPPREEIHRD